MQVIVSGKHPGCLSETRPQLFVRQRSPVQISVRFSLPNSRNRIVLMSTIHCTGQPQQKASGLLIKPPAAFNLRLLKRLEDAGDSTKRICYPLLRPFSRRAN